MPRLIALAPALVLMLVAGACNDDGGSAGGASTATWCRQMEEFQDLDDRLSTPDLSGQPSAAGILETMKKNFEEVDEVIEELRESSPSEIRDDVDVVARAFSEVNDQIQGADSFEELGDASSALTQSSEEIEEASDRIAEFARDECGIDLDDAGGVERQRDRGVTSPG